MASTPINVENIGAVFTALETWINQRPGLDPANYGLHPEQRKYSSPPQVAAAMKAWRAEVRSIGKDRKRALAALDEARGLQPAQPDALEEAFRGAFSGRLKLHACRVLSMRDLEAECTCGHWHMVAPTPDSEKEEVTLGRALEQHAQHVAAEGGTLTYCTGQYWPTEYRAAAAAVLEMYAHLWLQAEAAEHPRTFHYHTMDDVRAANASVGGHWFDAGSMRFFRTKIESGAVVIDGGQRARFITSEKGPDEIRKYSIREAQPDGSIDTVGEFQQYRTRDAARRDLLKEKEVQS